MLCLSEGVGLAPVKVVTMEMMRGARQYCRGTSYVQNCLRKRREHRMTPKSLQTRVFRGP